MISTFIRALAQMIESSVVRSRPTQEVAVVIPIYRPSLTPVEGTSLTQCRRVLGRYPIVFVAPQSLDLDPSITGSSLIERFPDAFFQSLDSYSRLLLSPEFYRRFSEFRFILVHQLDVFVFRDELMAWCAKGYDYVGAPWFDASFLKFVNTQTSRLRRVRAALGMASDRRVGNGGFSLRRVSSALSALKILRHVAERGGYEDVFWSMCVTSYLPWFRIPKWQTALAFSIEQCPARAVGLNGGRLPFGCHAWHLHEPEFWKTHIDAANEGGAP